MKRQLKDPRPILGFFFRMSLITLFFAPLIYFNVKGGHTSRIILFIVIWVIISLLIKFFYKTTEEHKLHDVVGVGYMFSGGWFFLALLFILSLTGFFRKMPSFSWTLVIGLLLFFSFILFYLSYKSMIYEKKILHYPYKLHLQDIFLTGLLVMVLLATMGSFIGTFLPLFFSKSVSSNFIIIDAILLSTLIILLLYAKYRKLFDKL